MDDLTLLRGVLSKTATVVDGVPSEQWDLPTPCAEFTVRDLLGHVVGWAEVFAAAAEAEQYDGDPSAYRADEGAAARFHSAADRMLDGWERLGVDRSVQLTTAELPAAMAVSMTAIEYLGHGWDLARATGQPSPWSEDEAAETLRRAEQTLPPHYRGDGKGFGAVVDVPADAPALERLMGFLGRDPAA